MRSNTESPRCKDCHQLTENTKIRSGQRSRFLVLTKRSAVSGDETLVPRVFVPYCACRFNKALVSPPLVKRNEDPGYDGGLQVFWFILSRLCVLSFSYLFAAVDLLLLGLPPVRECPRKHHRDGKFLPRSQV